MANDATRRVWQIGAGAANRSHAHTFLTYGVALIGPGDPGPWSPERYADEDDERFIRRFATELQKDDVVVLRVGMSAIHAVGIVDCEYHHLPVFEDVNGWDLQHCRRVRWFTLPEPYDFGAQVFGANPARLSRVSVSDIVQFANRFVTSPPTDWQHGMLPELPREEAELAAVDVPADLRDVVGAMQDLAGYYWDSTAVSDWPSEAETVAHLVVPFLGALGWAPERVAVEWRKIDICAFGTLPRSPENCHFMIEAKRLGTGLEGALGQAKSYVAELGVERDVIITDGLRYRMYDAASDFSPVAYANVRRLKRSALQLFSRLRSP